MAIEQGICASFVLELHQGIHDFDNDAFKAALFTADADLTPDTTVYSTTNEASGTGYTAGGSALVFADSTPKLSGRRLILNTDPIAWAGTFTFRGILLYNTSKANRAWAVIDYGTTVSLVDELFTLPPMLMDGVNSIYSAYQVS